MPIALSRRDAALVAQALRGQAFHHRQQAEHQSNPDFKVGKVREAEALERLIALFEDHAAGPKR